jgi:TPR repeat protein
MSYSGGVGVTASNERAMEWMTRAASLGFARSQYSMGIYCRDGIGTPMDKARSAQYFKSAADQVCSMYITRV